MRSTRWAAATCAAVLACALPSSAANPEATTLTVAVPSTSRVALDVPVGTYLAIDREQSADWNYAHFEVEGDAALGGYLLARRDTGARHHYGLRIPAKVLDIEEEMFGMDSACHVQGTRCQIPPGPYWLYVIAEGGAANITLSFDGAAPMITSGPDVVTSVISWGERSGPRNAPGGGVETATYTLTAPKPGYHLGMGWAGYTERLPVASESSYVTVQGFCVYDGAPAVAPPACPAAGAKQVYPAAEVEDDRAYIGSIVADGYSGTTSGSQYHATAGVPPAALGAVGLWLQP